MIKKGLAFIPARAWPPQKMLWSIGGKSLVQIALESALKSDCFTKIIVASDDISIIKTVKTHQRVTVEKLSKYITSPHATVFNTFQEYINNHDLSEFNYIAMLLPTCPLRSPADIKGAIKLLNDNTDSVISVTAFNFPIEMALTLDKEKVISIPFESSPLLFGNTVRENQQKYFYPNGGIYLTKVSSFMKFANFFKGKVNPYIMDKYSSFSIDEKNDVKIAEFIQREKLQNL